MGLSVYLTVDSQDVFYGGITHNLSKMAAEAGIYNVLWRADEASIRFAQQMIPDLESGIEALQRDPARFIPFNPKNGYGNYYLLLSFAENCLNACRTYPSATVEIFR